MLVSEPRKIAPRALCVTQQVRSTEHQAKRRGVARWEYKPIICVFPENIITRFDVSVNDVSKEFAKKLRIFLLISIFPNKDKSNMLDKLYGNDYGI